MFTMAEFTDDVAIPSSSYTRLYIAGELSYCSWIYAVNFEFELEYRYIIFMFTFHSFFSPIYVCMCVSIVAFLYFCTV